jgi:drug/metabolite transporter (DMT)-like permease
MPIIYYVYLLLNAVLLSGNYVASKLVLADTDPLFVALIMLWSTTLYAGAFIVYRQRSLNVFRDLRHWGPVVRRDLACLGVSSAVAYLGAFYALTFLSPGLFSFIDGIVFPTVLALTAFLLAGDRLSPGLILGVGLGVVGLVIFQSSSLAQLNLNVGPGHLLTVVASSGYAVSMVLVRRLRVRGVAAEKAVFYRFLLLDLALPFLILARPGVTIGPGAAWLPLVALLGLAIPLYMIFYVLHDVPAHLFAVTEPLYPLSAYCLSLAFIPGERFQPVHLIGIVAMVAGMVVGLRHERQSRPALAVAVEPSPSAPCVPADYT